MVFYFCFIKLDNLKLNLMNKSILILLFAFLSVTALAQNSRATHFNLENKIAIQGYDPVAYFTQKKAVILQSDNYHHKYDV